MLVQLKISSGCNLKSPYVLQNCPSSSGVLITGCIQNIFFRLFKNITLFKPRNTISKSMSSALPINFKIRKQKTERKQKQTQVSKRFEKNSARDVIIQ